MENKTSQKLLFLSHLCRPNKIPPPICRKDELFLLPHMTGEWILLPMEDLTIHTPNMPQTTERQVAITLPSMSPELTYEDVVSMGTLFLSLSTILVLDLCASSISPVLYPAFLLTEADVRVNMFPDYKSLADTLSPYSQF